MARKNETKEEEREEVLETEAVQPLTVEFSNGDLNLLRLKLNEVISRLS